MRYFIRLLRCWEGRAYDIFCVIKFQCYKNKFKRHPGEDAFFMQNIQLKFVFPYLRSVSFPTFTKLGVSSL